MGKRENHKPQGKTAAAILDMAKKHNVSYTPTRRDAWANDVTRLSGDEIEFDEIELLLLALQRAGHISDPEALKLQAEYLREEKQ